MSRLRIVRVGPGHPHAASILETLRQLPEVEVVGTCEAAELGPALRELGPDAAIVTLPADTTPTAIVQAAEAGVHVYADKPVARCAAELLPAVDAVRRAGIRTTHGYLRRFMPAGIAIRDLVEQGVLGRLVSIEARWITTSVARRGPASLYFDRARSGGGMLNWLACHYLDFMRWTTSAEVAEVAAVTARLSDEPIDVEDVATLALRYSNGMVGSLHCAYVTDRDTDQAFRLRGSLGWVSWDGAGPQIDARSVHPSWGAAPSRAMRFEPEPVPGYGRGAGVEAFRRFFAACRGDEPPADSIEDALRVLETLDAAHEAARTGRIVEPERHAATHG